MAAKFFRLRSSRETLGFEAVIISCIMVFHAFLLNCDAMNTAGGDLLAMDDSGAQAGMIIPKDEMVQTLMNGQAEKEMCVYTITTVTGKKWGAGTDSTISLRLYNNASQVVFFPNLDNANNNFEKGKVDKFQEPGDCVEYICKMVLYTDNSGFMPAWFVDSLGVSVTTPAAGLQTNTWQLHEWLPKDDSSATFFDLRDNCV